MAFDGNGNWVSNFSAEADRDAGYKILASRFDNIFIADIAQSFENCLTKDMQVKPQQAFDANSYKVINVANPTNSNDAVNLATLNAKDATAVHQAGNEQITGDKTISGRIISSGANTWAGTNTFSNAVTFSGSVSLGNSATATTQATSDSSTKVATTAWVKTSGNGVVHTTGSETIGGNKTFSGSTTHSGTTTFSNTVTLGSSATVSTPSTTDNSQKVANTVYVVNVLKAIYPVGSVYIGTQNTCPMSAFFGTWTLVSSGKALWTGTGSNGASTINAGLPDISGTMGNANTAEKGIINGETFTGAFSGSSEHGSKGFSTASAGASHPHTITFKASDSNSIYGASSTVQPPAYVVNVWQRTA